MLIIILAYILGAIPAGYLLNRRVETRVRRALLVLPLRAPWRDQAVRLAPRGLSAIADLVKGALIVWTIPALVEHSAAGQWAWLAYPLVSPGLRASAVLVSMVVGHVLSVFISGWGGRGVATALGGFLVLTPVPACAAMVVWLVLALVTRSFRSSAIAASFALPLLLILWQPFDVLYALAALLLALLSIATHAEDLLAQWHARRRSN